MFGFIGSFVSPSSSRLEKMLYNQAMVTFFKESVTAEVFDKTSVLTEIYNLHDMMPMHIGYFVILCGLIYSQRDLLLDFSKEYHLFNTSAIEIYKETKYYKLLPDAITMKRNIRIVVLVFLFLFARNMDSAR